MACSLQLPLFSQDGQKWLPSANSICTSVRLSSFSSSVLLCTSIPASARRVQEVIVCPPVAAVHSLQLPCGSNSGW